MHAPPIPEHTTMYAIHGCTLPRVPCTRPCMRSTLGGAGSAMRQDRTGEMRAVTSGAVLCTRRGGRTSEADREKRTSEGRQARVLHGVAARYRALRGGGTGTGRAARDRGLAAGAGCDATPTPTHRGRTARALDGNVPFLNALSLVQRSVARDSGSAVSGNGSHNSQTI